MQIVSKEFAAAMEHLPYVAKITLDGVDTIQGEAVQQIAFRGGANASTEAFMLGCAVSGSVELSLDGNAVSCPIAGRELFIELGIELAAGIEWISMGKYFADDPVTDEGNLMVTARDALGSKLDVDYEPIEGFDFDAEEGVSSTAFLAALCARRGVAVDMAGLEPVPLRISPEGFTERQIAGFISALYGGFAHVDRHGVLRVCYYGASDVKVTADTYYEDGLEKAAYSFTVGWLKCYNEINELSMFVGDMDAQQGINLESIWMTQQILNSLWEKWEGFSYRPVPELSFMGNPLIDPGDIICLEDIGGEPVSVPVMTVTHDFDGGIVTSVTAYGQAVTSEYAGPTRKAVARSISAAKAYAAGENAKLDQLELLKRLTKNWIDDGIYLTEDGKLAVNASALLTGILASVDGKIVIDLNGGSSGPVFNTGISTNGITVRGDEAGAPVLCRVKVERVDDKETAYLCFYDVDGHELITLTEDASQTGGGMRVASNNKALWAIAQATATSAGFRLLHNGATKAYLGMNATGFSSLVCDSVNPGKKELYRGSVSSGDTFTVPNANYYDLFAILLGNDFGEISTSVLAYKVNNKIYGIGGWCGTRGQDSYPRQIFYVSATFSDDTWTLIDAGVNDISTSGTVSAGDRLQLKRVIGII